MDLSKLKKSELEAMLRKVLAEQQTSKAEIGLYITLKDQKPGENGEAYQPLSFTFGRNFNDKRGVTKHTSDQSNLYKFLIDHIVEEDGQRRLKLDIPVDIRKQSGSVSIERPSDDEIPF